MLKTSPRFSFFFLTGSLGLALALPVIAQTQPCPGTGSSNTCYGFQALFSNTTGSQNTANGYQALFSNTTGTWNTATGAFALNSNTTGDTNIATGNQALFSNTTGSSNTATGNQALFSNTTGTSNTANGYLALVNNTTGSSNTADGTQALISDTTGSQNTANGYDALYSNTTGNNNTANGVEALRANTTGTNNIALGYQAGKRTTGSNNVAIANSGVTGESGVIRIGTIGTQTRTLIAGIGAQVTGAALFVNSLGQVGIKTSSKRFKIDIHPLGKTSEKILNLRPVTFRYKEQDEHGQHPLEYGLIAEEVAKVYPELVQYDKDGKPFTVYYDALTPLLLGAVQKEHAINLKQQAENQQQNGKIASLQAENQALKAALKQQGIQLAALKQAQAQQLQILSKLAVLTQAKTKVQPQKAIYQP